MHCVRWLSFAIGLCSALCSLRSLALLNFPVARSLSPVCLCEIRLNQFVRIIEEVISTKGIHLTPHDRIDRDDFVFVALFRSSTVPFDFPMFLAVLRR